MSSVLKMRAHEHLVLFKKTVTISVCREPSIYKSPTSFLALVQMESTWADQDKSVDRRTPRYLKVLTCSRGSHLVGVVGIV